MKFIGRPPNGPLLCGGREGGLQAEQLLTLSVFPQGTFSLIIEALHTDSLDDLTTGGWQPQKAAV